MKTDSRIKRGFVEAVAAAFVVAVLAGCGGKRTDDAALPVVQRENTPPTVGYIVLKPGDFADEILSNGTLASYREAEVKWKATEEIVRVFVKDGDRVAKGQVLAQLDKTDAEAGVQRSRDEMVKAMLDMQDFLIGQGYQLSDTSNIPAKIRDVAQLKSGYRSAVLSHKAAMTVLGNTTLRAPISGVIANISAKEHNGAAAGEMFCKILDNSSMKATFPLMEDELHSVPKGTIVEVALVSNEKETRTGKVETINPVVNSDGLANATAVIKSVPRNWFDGMKVSVRIQKMKPSMLVVPKSAVVIRDGKHVAFTIRGGKAYWNYVTIGMENSRENTKETGLSSGDRVIVAGNNYLAHLSQIITGRNASVPQSGSGK